MLAACDLDLARFEVLAARQVLVLIVARARLSVALGGDNYFRYVVVTALVVVER